MNDERNHRELMRLLKPSLPVNDTGETNPVIAALVLTACMASLDPVTVASSIIAHNREHGNLIDLLPSLAELMRNPPTLNLPDWFKDDFGGWDDADDQP
jgi:hypothetical protein